MRHNEDKLNAEFAEHCPLEVRFMSSFAMSLRGGLGDSSLRLSAHEGLPAAAGGSFWWPSSPSTGDFGHVSRLTKLLKTSW